MKRSLLFVCIGLLAATTASAQNPPAQSGPNNSAVNSPGQNNSNAPVAGRNSFTEGQAKSKIEDAGLHQRHRTEKGRQWCLARQGQQGRVCHCSKRRFSRQRKQRQVRKV